MSLASIKRRVKVGSRLQVVRHDWPALRLHGQTDEEYTAKRAAFFAVREVVSVRGGEIGLRTGEDRTSYLTWPKAGSIRETPKGFQVDLNGAGDFAAVMEYEYRD
jgi:hypothetical protein